MRPRIHSVVLAAFPAYSTADVLYLLPTYAAMLVTKWGSNPTQKKAAKGGEKVEKIYSVENFFKKEYKGRVCSFLTDIHIQMYAKSFFQQKHRSRWW